MRLQICFIILITLSFNYYCQENKQIIIPQTDFVQRKSTFDESILRVAHIVLKKQLNNLDTIIDSWRFVFQRADGNWKTVDIMIDNYTVRSIKFNNRSFEMIQNDYIINAKLNKNGCLKFLKMSISDSNTKRSVIILKIVRKGADLVVLKEPKHFTEKKLSPYKAVNEIENFLYLFLVHF